MKGALAIDPAKVANLDRTLHEPARLSVMACLAVIEEADFVFIQNQTGMTGGNLSTHIRKLEQADYVTIDKAFVGAWPRTALRMTTAGRAAFAAYVETMRELFQTLAD